MQHIKLFGHKKRLKENRHRFFPCCPPLLFWSTGWIFLVVIISPERFTARLLCSPGNLCSATSLNKNLVTYQSVHMSFPLLMTHSINQSAATLRWVFCVFQSAVRVYSAERWSVAILRRCYCLCLLALCLGVQCRNACVCVACQTRWGRRPPSIRRGQWSDHRWPNLVGYRWSGHVTVSNLCSV